MNRWKEDRVELLPAFLWICPDCGRDNFERSIIIEFSPEEMKSLRDDHGIESWQTSDFITTPTEVACAGCDKHFSAHAFGSDD